jgi:hypothetical protein
MSVIVMFLLLIAIASQRQQIGSRSLRGTDMRVYLASPQFSHEQQVLLSIAHKSISSFVSWSTEA